MADKILLLNDYSSYHLNLRDGFREIGLEATMISDGDGYKKLETDINFPKKNIFHKVNQKLGNYVEIIKNINSFINYDYALMVTPAFFWGNADHLFLPLLRKFNGKYVYNSSGLDYVYFKAYQSGLLKEMGYHSQEAILKDFQESSHISRLDHTDKTARAIQRQAIDKADAITFCGYDYYICYEKYQFLNKPHHLVFLPINISKFEYIEPKKRDKVTIFHGIQKVKEHFKGTHLTIKALDEIKKIYGDSVDIQMSSNLTFSEWVEVVNNCDIYIDQPYSFDVGMGALYAMVLGKVVLTGAEKKALDLKGLDEVPYFNIRPESEHIKNVLINLIERKSELKEIGYKAHEFVKKYHDHVKVATEYYDFLKTL